MLQEREEIDRVLSLKRRQRRASECKAQSLAAGERVGSSSTVQEERQHHGRSSRSDGGCGAGSWWEFMSDNLNASFFLGKEEERSQAKVKNEEERAGHRREK